MEEACSGKVSQSRLLLDAQRQREGETVSGDNETIGLPQSLKEIRFLHGLHWENLQYMAKHMGGKKWSTMRGVQKKPQGDRKESRGDWEEIRVVRISVE